MPADRRPAGPRALLTILLIAAATLVALAAVSETTARLLFPASATTTMPCLVATDPVTGVRGIPGALCHQKALEAPTVEYRYDDCGFRTPQPCRPAPPGIYRIVMIGSSVPYAMHVEQAQGFGARLGPLLSRRLGRPVDVFNEAMQWGTPTSLARRTDAMLRPHPDMILWTLTPFDIENARLLLPFVPGAQQQLTVPGPTPDPPPPPPASKRAIDLPQRAWARLIADLTDTRTVFLAQHLLYRSPSQYLAHTLAQGQAIDYLRTPPARELTDNLTVFGQALGRIASRARAAGVPLVVTLAPSRPQAIMIAARSWNQGYDPNQLGRLIRPIVAAKGATYVDMTRGLGAIPNAGSLYFPVDEHLPPKGHVMLAHLLADALQRSGMLEPRR